MKSLAGVFIALFLMAFAVGCTGGGGEPNTNQGTTENYEDPNYKPSYATSAGDSGASGGTAAPAAPADGSSP